MTSFHGAQSPAEYSLPTTSSYEGNAALHLTHIMVYKYSRGPQQAGMWSEKVKEVQLKLISLPLLLPVGSEQESQCLYQQIIRLVTLSHLQEPSSLHFVFAVGINLAVFKVLAHPSLEQQKQSYRWDLGSCCYSKSSDQQDFLWFKHETRADLTD